MLKNEANSDMENKTTHMNQITTQMKQQIQIKCVSNSWNEYMQSEKKKKQKKKWTQS